MPDPVIRIRDLSKSFTLHTQGGARIEVLRGARLDVHAGECVALTGASGAGKSTLMRLAWGNYRATSGRIEICGTDLVQAPPREIMELRRLKLGYVSQFLRVIPRVPTLEVVAEPALAAGAPPAEAFARARALLARLAIPEALWSLSPTTFSGGEQQRVNIARGFAHPCPALLLDEPTASLDPANRETVLALVSDAKAQGAAVLGIFHDAEARARLADREVDVATFAPGSGAPAFAAGCPA